MKLTPYTYSNNGIYDTMETVCSHKSTITSYVMIGSLACQECRYLIDYLDDNHNHLICKLDQEEENVCKKH